LRFAHHNWSETFLLGKTLKQCKNGDFYPNANQSRRLTPKSGLNTIENVNRAREGGNGSSRKENDSTKRSKSKKYAASRGKKRGHHFAGKGERKKKMKKKKKRKKTT